MGLAHSSTSTHTFELPCHQVNKRPFGSNTRYYLFKMIRKFDHGIPPDRSLIHKPNCLMTVRVKHGIQMCPLVPPTASEGTTLSVEGRNLDGAMRKAGKKKLSQVKVECDPGYLIKTPVVSALFLQTQNFQDSQSITPQILQPIFVSISILFFCGSIARLDFTILYIQKCFNRLSPMVASPKV